MKIEEFKNLKEKDELYVIYNYSIFKENVSSTSHMWVYGLRFKEGFMINECALTENEAKTLLKNKIEFDINKYADEISHLNYKIIECKKILDELLIKEEIKND